MKALVTGGGGFLGRSIVMKLLARGDTVRVLGRRPYPDLAALGVEPVRGDLQDAAAVQLACLGMDTVFHVAARAGYWGSWRSEERRVGKECRAGWAGGPAEERRAESADRRVRCR